MNWIQQIFAHIGQLFRWWFVVLPWEQAVRVRLGKQVVVMGGGVHFQIPFFDRVYLQNVRKRILAVTPQTITTLDGKTISCAGSLGYRIENVLTLYQTLHQPEDTIRQQVEGLLARYVVEHRLEDCSAKLVAEHVSKELDLDLYGLNEAEFFLTDFAVVRTYRIIGGNMERYTYGRLETMNTVQNLPPL